MVLLVLLIFVMNTTLLQSSQLHSKNQETFTSDSTYWENRWKKDETGWDIGYPSPAITEYLEKITDKNLAILIPGCGNAYEAEYLFRNGFTNVTLIDIAPSVVKMLKNKFSYDPQIEVKNENFFDHEGRYDLILEQTFFCAISPDLRSDFVKKASELLKPNGKIVGLLFNREFQQSPPYGGSSAEYKFLFEPYFELKKMENCYNSIPERQGAELFIHFIKK